MDKKSSKEAPNRPNHLRTSQFCNSQGGQSQAGKFSVQLTGGSEVEGVHSQAGCGDSIFLNVVNVERFVGRNIQSLQGVAVDGRGGLGGSHPAGVSAHWNMPDKWVCGFNMRDV